MDDIYSLSKFIQEVTDLLQDVKYLMGDLKDQETLFSLNVADSLALLQSTFLKMHSLTGSLHSLECFASTAGVVPTPEVKAELLSP